MPEMRKYQPHTAFAGDTRDWRAESAARTAEANFHRRTLALESRYVPPPDDGEEDPTPDPLEQPEMNQTRNITETAEAMWNRNAALPDGRLTRDVFNSVRGLRAYLASKDATIAEASTGRPANRAAVEWEDVTV